jgi:ribosome-associated protein
VDLYHHAIAQGKLNRHPRTPQSFTLKPRPAASKNSIIAFPRQRTTTLKKPVKKSAAKAKAKSPAKKKPVASKTATRRPVKKVAVKKQLAVRKPAAKKTAARKLVAKKTAMKKTIAKKAAAKTAVTKTVVAKNLVAKKFTAKRITVKKSPAKKTPAKKVVTKAKPLVAAPRKAPAKATPPQSGQMTKTAERKAKRAVKQATLPRPAAAAAAPIAWSPLITAVLNQLDDAKAEQVVAMDLTGKSTIADTMVVASGRSNRHVNAIADQVVEELYKHGLKNIRIEGVPQCDWVLVDAGDVIVHVFRPEVRSFYNLEKLWAANVPE